jgi:cytochrome P450
MGARLCIAQNISLIVQQPVAPEWSWLAGNLVFIGKVFELIPKKAHKTLMFSEIVRRYFPNEGCCYLDLWPFSYPFLMVMNPELATQATQTSPRTACERPLRLDDFFKPLAGGPNLFDLPEKDWKPWRTIFNKGFSENNVSALVPGMVEEAVEYRNTLAKLAGKGELVQLDPITLRFTIDFIGRTTL